eukprot:scaffold4665_cov162-Skeletonema_marinoi.AAC.3
MILPENLVSVPTYVNIPTSSNANNAKCQRCHMPPPPRKQQHPPMQQQQLFSPNGQTQPVGQFPPHQQMQMMNQQGPPPQVSPQPVAAASPASAAAASAPTADEWTEHRSVQGIPYYFNTITNVSTYERPASLSQTPTSKSKAT